MLYVTLPAFIFSHEQHCEEIFYSLENQNMKLYIFPIYMIMYYQKSINPIIGN